MKVGKCTGSVAPRDEDDNGLCDIQSLKPKCSSPR